MEFVPYIGPIIGPLPAVLVALFNDPVSALWVVLLFVALQQLEGHFVAPQVFRLSLRINPIVIILSLLIGYQLYGIVGSLVALPVAAVVRQTVLYLRKHLVLEPWGTYSPESGALVIGPDRCPECGTRASPRDSFCRTCGASFEPRVAGPGTGRHGGRQTPRRDASGSPVAPPANTLAFEAPPAAPGFVLGPSCSAATRRVLRPRPASTGGTSRCDRTYVRNH